MPGIVGPGLRIPLQQTERGLASPHTERKSTKMKKNAIATKIAAAACALALVATPNLEETLAVLDSIQEHYK